MQYLCIPAACLGVTFFPWLNTIRRRSGDVTLIVAVFESGRVLQTTKGVWIIGFCVPTYCAG